MMPSPPPPAPSADEQEAVALKQTVRDLRKQLADVLDRLDRLEKGDYTMRVAISADDNQGLNGVVSPHFGRCPYFAVVDLEEREVQAVEVVSNPFFQQHQPGQVPMFIHSHGVDVMLTGGMGRRAIDIFQQLGIHAATGAYGTVRQALEGYLNGALSVAEPCRESVEHAHEDEGEYEQDESGRLREEIEMLQKHLAEATARVNRLVKGKGE
jgi:predicted Fe-Mo cluster-binding NifX family protein